MMQQPMNTNPVQVVVLAQPGIVDKQSIYKNMRIGLARQLIALGILQVIIGILCIIFQGVALGIFLNGYFSIDFVGHGFWNGLLFLITGPFGISGGIKRSRCQIITFNVLSILSAAFAWILVGISVPAAILYSSGGSDCNSYYRYFYYYPCTPTGKRETRIAMDSMMAILGLIEGIIAIWSSVVCCTIGACCCNCGGSCCCPQSPLQNQLLMTGQPFAGQQIMIATQHQSGSNQQPQIFIPNQQPTFLPSPEQPIIALDPRLQMALYNPQQPPHSQQLSAYTPLSQALGVQSPYTGLDPGMRDTFVAPEQRAVPGDRTSEYDEIHAYGVIGNKRN